MKKKILYTGVHGREANMEIAKTLLSKEKPYAQTATLNIVNTEEVDIAFVKPFPGKSFVQEIVNAEHVKRSVAAFDKHLAEQTRKVLEAKGFTFENEGDFKLFCRDRLTVVSFEDNEFRKEMYLDLKSPEEPGTLLFRFSTEITTKYDNGVLTTTFG